MYLCVYVYVHMYVHMLYVCLCGCWFMSVCMLCSRESGCMCMSGYACVYRFSYTCMHVRMEARGQPYAVAQVPSAGFLSQCLSLAWNPLIQLGCLVPVRSPVSNSISSAVRLQACTTVLAFHHGCWRSNSGPRSWKANTLTAEPSPQPNTLFASGK